MVETGLKHFDRGDLVLYTRTDWFPYDGESACAYHRNDCLFLRFLSEGYI